MQHLISTPFGKVLGIVNEKNNSTDIVDATTLKRLASTQGTSYEAMLFAVRRIVSLTRFTVDCAARKITIYHTFENMTEIDRPKRTRKPKAAAQEAMPEVSASEVLPTPVQATPQSEGPKPLVALVAEASGNVPANAQPAPRRQRTKKGNENVANG